MSIKSLGSSMKNSTTNSESFDLNFKQIEQTNQILNNIEGKLNSFFKKKKKSDNSLEVSTFKSQKQSPIKNIESYESSFIKKTQTKGNLFSNALINESLNHKYEEKDDLQITEQRLQEDLGSLKERLNSIQTKIPLALEENSDGSEKERRSIKLQNFKEKNENISSNYFQEKIKILEEKIEILNKELSSVNDEKTHLLEETEKLKEMLSLMNRNHGEELRRLNNQNSDFINEIESLKSEKTLLQMKLVENESNFNLLQDEMRVLETKYKNAVTLANNEQFKAENAAKGMQDEIKSLESKYKSALIITNSQEKIPVKEENINNDLFKMLSSYQEELERIKMTNKGISDHFKNEMNKLQGELQSQKIENETIKEELVNLKKGNKCDGKFNPEKNISEYTRNLELNYNELEAQHQQQIEKNNEMKHLLDKISHKNKEEFKNFNDLYQEIYGKQSEPVLKKVDKIETNNSVLQTQINEKKHSRGPSRGRDKSKKEIKTTMKSTSKSGVIKSQSTSSDKENRLDKCHKEIRRLKDLVNEKITLKKKEKPKKKKK